MEQQLSFEFKVSFSEQQKKPSVKKHLFRKKRHQLKRRNVKKQAVKELLPIMKKDAKLGLDFLSLKEIVQKKPKLELSALKTSLREQTLKKEPLFDNQIELISVKTVAEMLGLAPKTIHNWVYLRKIPYVKSGRKVMFRPKSLKAWLNRKEKEAKSWL